MKRIIAFALLLALLLPSTFVLAESSVQLQFHEDGSFRIMVLADTHVGTGGRLMRDQMKEYFQRVVDSEAKPDLIVLLGDNLSADLGCDIATATTYIDDLMTMLEPLGVPVAAVFGNHDGYAEPESPSKYAQMAVYEKYDCFIGCVGFSVDINDESGNTSVGNYNLTVLSSDGSRVALNLWFFDNGATKVPAEVLAWYVETSNALKEANGGVAVPSYVFQHVMMKEVEYALIPDDSTNDGFRLPETATGVLDERPGTWNDSEEQFAAFLQQGDVIAAFHGHDHKNNYVVPYQGIDLVNVPSWSRMGDTFGQKTRGVYFIDINENDLAGYVTHTVRPQDFGENSFYGLALPWESLTASR